MPNNWKTYKLGEIVDVKQGLAINKKTDHLLTDKSSMPLFKIRDLINNTVEHYVKEDEVPKQCIANYEDLIYSRTGQVGLVFRGKIGCIHNNCFKIIPNESIINKDLLFWFLKQPEIIEYANNIASGSVQKDLNHTAFKSIEISISDNINEQKNIAEIFNIINDKIENNLAINKTLEEMAMALYKYWFVDFGPFQDGEFVESELGRIPKGWEVKQLEELVDVGSSKRIFYNEYVEAGIPFYRGKEVIELSKGKSISSELFITIEKFQEIKSKFEVPKKGDILISSVGTIGVSWLVDGFEDFYFKDGNLTWLKNYKTFIKGEYLHLWLNSENGKKQIDGEVIGSTQKALTISSLRNFKILFPSQSVYKQIGEEFENYYEQRQLNLIEIKTLTQLRDTLLPKLISGEVRLKEFQES